MQCSLEDIFKFNAAGTKSFSNCLMKLFQTKMLQPFSKTAELKKLYFGCFAIMFYILSFTNELQKFLSCTLSKKCSFSDAKNAL